MVDVSPVINGYGYSDVITNGQNLTSTMNVSQSVFQKKTLDAQYSRFGIQNQAITNMSKLTVNDLKKTITDQYLSTCIVWLEKSTDIDLLKTNKDEDDILKQLVVRGLYRQTDYLAFHIETESLSIRITSLDIQYRRELSALKTLCGIQDTALYLVSLPDLNYKPLMTSISSPLFMRFTIDSLKIQNERLLLDRRYKPEIKWFSDAGLINNEPKFLYQNFGISLGVSLTLPIYDGNQHKLNDEKLKSSEDTRKNYEDFFRHQYDQQLRQLNDELNTTQELTGQMMKQVDLFHELIREDQLLLNRGEISITDYITAMKNLITAQMELNQSRIKQLQVINEINYLLQN